VRIFYINNLGGGYANYLDIPSGTTISQLFTEQLKDARPEDFLIRVNRQLAPSDQVLQPDDRVSFTPVKIEGAAR
jgi:hypothetical protein